MIIHECIQARDGSNFIFQTCSERVNYVFIIINQILSGSTTPY
jgi:hypothetical protein